jgi:diaminohydroxyphosphoribosylaminopyrimidine deaminase/5-amino-6-(5-phosphoribosylamino)uracil reductase
MNGWTKDQIGYMKMVLRLARRGWGLVSPNPMVGAVVVKGKKVLGSGWHTGPGQPHAEAAALLEAGRKAKGADLYVNLEPCNHYGRTGPCTEAILRAGIDRVFYGSPDPSSMAAGGANALREAGVEVFGGLLAEECFELNQFFFKWLATKTPFVIMKTAASLDGKTATSAGESQWISSKAARNFGHHIRAGVDAVLIGRNTAEKDDPELSARPWGRRKMHRQPWRVVLDPALKLSIKLKIFDSKMGGPTVIVCAREKANEKKIAAITSMGHQVLMAPQTAGGLLSIRWVVEELGSQGLQSVLIEPGATLAASALIEEPVVDLAHIFLAPKFIGGLKAPGLIGGPGLPELAQAQEAEILKFGRKGPDLHITLQPAGAFGGPADLEALCSRV